AEIREVEDSADHAAIEWLALIGIYRVTHTQHATDVEHLDDIARLNGWRYVTGVPEQRLAMTQRSNNDITFADLRHAAAGQLQSVVGRLIGQHLDRDNDAFLGGNICGHAHFVRQLARLCYRGNLVDNDTSHPVNHLKHPWRGRPHDG